MPDPADILQDRFRAAIAKAFGEQYAAVDPLIRPSQNPRFGDYQANVAMGLGKQLGKPPRDVAAAIVEHVRVDDVCTTPLEIAGPGFINLRLRNHWLGEAVRQLTADDRLAVPRAAHPVRTVVDYSSPNVAKEMHVGHLRSTVIGDAIARVLGFQGHEVIRQNHVGDWGTQFGRVMLGLWYDAAAAHAGESQRLERWMRIVATLPARVERETPDQTKARHAAENMLLDELVPLHIQWYRMDEDGRRFFLPYLSNSFPDAPRLQQLYTFASAITSLECSAQRMLPMSGGGEKSLAALPSHIATFVQQQRLPRNEPERVAWQRCKKLTLDASQAIYDRLGVLLLPSDERGESFYSLGDDADPRDRLEEVLPALRQAGLLQQSQGADVVYPRGFTGREDEPLAMIVRKSDGGYLYATTDLAAVRYRIFELGAKRIVYVTDARQSQHFAMLFQVARDAGWAAAEVRLDHVPFGTVMGEDGRPFKTREGKTVALADLLDEAEQRAEAIVTQKNPELTDAERKRVAHVVGIGAVKYADLSGDRVKDYVFSWDRMLAMEGNTAPYLQYAYARIRSIFRKAGIDAASLRNVAPVIEHDAERALTLKLLQLGGVIDSVAQSLEPHRLCTYLYELAVAFSSFYENCPVLTASNEAARMSRLALCEAAARTLKLGLGLLGIEVLERM